MGRCLKALLPGNAGELNICTSTAHKATARLSGWTQLCLHSLMLWTVEWRYTDTSYTVTKLCIVTLMFTLLCVQSINSEADSYCLYFGGDQLSYTIDAVKLSPLFRAPVYSRWRDLYCMCIVTVFNWYSMSVYWVGQILLHFTFIWYSLSGGLKALTGKACRKELWCPLSYPMWVSLHHTIFPWIIAIF